MTKLAVTILIIGLIIVLLLAFSANTSAESWKEYRVKPNETLWQIVSEHYPDRDVREVIYDIRIKNNIVNCEIYPGETILLPIYAED